MEATGVSPTRSRCRVAEALRPPGWAYSPPVTDLVEAIAKALPAVVPLGTALFAATRGPSVLRSRIKHDAEVVEKLPDSEARTALLDLVKDEVEQLRLDGQGSRNLSTLVMAFIGALGTGYLTVWLVSRGTWWG